MQGIVFSIPCGKVKSELCFKLTRLIKYNRVLFKVYKTDLFILNQPAPCILQTIGAKGIRLIHAHTLFTCHMRDVISMLRIMSLKCYLLCYVCHLLCYVLRDKTNLYDVINVWDNASAFIYLHRIFLPTDVPIEPWVIHSTMDLLHIRFRTKDNQQ